MACTLQALLTILDDDTEKLRRLECKARRVKPALFPRRGLWKALKPLGKMIQAVFLARLVQTQTRRTPLVPLMARTATFNAMIRLVAALAREVEPALMARYRQVHHHTLRAQ